MEGTKSAGLNLADWSGVMLGIMAMLFLVSLAAIIVSSLAITRDPTDGPAWNHSQILNGNFTVNGDIEAEGISADAFGPINCSGAITGTTLSISGASSSDTLTSRTAEFTELATARDLTVTHAIQMPTTVNINQGLADSLAVTSNISADTIEAKTAASVGALTAVSISTPSLALTNSVSAPLVTTTTINATNANAQNLSVASGGTVDIESATEIIDTSLTVSDSGSGRLAVIENGDVTMDGAVRASEGVVYPMLRLAKLTADAPNQNYPWKSNTNWYAPGQTELARIIAFEDPSGVVSSGPDVNATMTYVAPNINVFSANPADFSGALPVGFSWPPGGRVIEYPLSADFPPPINSLAQGGYVHCRRAGTYQIYLQATPQITSGSLGAPLLYPTVVCVPFSAPGVSPPAQTAWTQRAQYPHITGFSASKNYLAATATGTITLPANTDGYAIYPVMTRLDGGIGDNIIFNLYASVLNSALVRMQIVYLGLDS